MSPREFKPGDRVEYVASTGGMTGHHGTVVAAETTVFSPGGYVRVAWDQSARYSRTFEPPYNLRAVENEPVSAAVEPTDEQRAAVEWLQSVTSDTYSPRGEAGHARALLAALPDNLTNPQPVRPTEPGHYEDDEGRHWLHQVYDGKGDHPDVDQWLNWGGQTAEPPAVLHRLVRQRQQLTTDDFLNCWGSLGFASYDTRLVLANAAADFVNGDAR